MKHFSERRAFRMTQPSLTRVAHRALQPDESDVVSSVNRPRIKALMRNDFVNLIDAHRISAVPSHTVFAQAQVVIAQPDIRPKREFSNQPSAIDLRLTTYKEPTRWMMSPVRQWPAVRTYLWLIKLPAQFIEISPVAGKETFETKNLLFNLVLLTFPILEQSQPGKFLSCGALEVETLQKFFQFFAFLKGHQQRENLLVQNKFDSRFSPVHIHLSSAADCWNFYK